MKGSKFHINNSGCKGQCTLDLSAEDNSNFKPAGIASNLRGNGDVILRDIFIISEHLFIPVK